MFRAEGTVSGATIANDFACGSELCPGPDIVNASPPAEVRSHIAQVAFGSRPRKAAAPRKKTMAAAAGGGATGRVYKRTTSTDESGLFLALGDPRDPIRLCVLEKDEHGKTTRLQDRCTPATQTRDGMARHSAKCNRDKHIHKEEREAYVAQMGGVVAAREWAQQQAWDQHAAQHAQLSLVLAT